MATNKHTSRIRSPRNTARTPSPPERPTPVSATALWHSLREAIEAERSRLMTAEAVLHSVAIAMDDDDRDDANSPHYPTLVELAREIVKRTIDQLDSVRVKATLEQNGGRHGYEVKESFVEYVVH